MVIEHQAALPTSLPERLKDRIRLGNVSLHSLSFGESVSKIEEYIAGGSPHQIVTVNLDFLWIAQSDEEYRELINTADLAIADGVPLLWISRLAGAPLPERVNGTDLLFKLAIQSQSRGYRLFLLGDEEGVAAEAATVLRRLFPDMVPASTYSPPMGEWNEEVEERIIEAVREAKPDVLFVGLGAPRQDKWIRKNLERLRVPVCVGVGGSIGLVAGRTERAPHWWRKNGLEWLHRLYKEPRRLSRRYLLHDAPLLTWLAFWAVRERIEGRGQSSALMTYPQGPDSNPDN
jgi:N-acetylglucosaminyldiphosphoundecaprenol N-acetyl-beta-D-mannosaminyltransferase